MFERAARVAARSAHRDHAGAHAAADLSAAELGLNRVLLNSISAKASQTVTIGVSSEVRSSPLPDFLIGGWQLLSDQDHSPVFVEPTLTVSKDELKSSENAESALPVPEMLVIEKDISQQLQNRAVDLIIVRKIRTRELPTREGVRRTPEDDLVFRAMGDYEVQYRLNDAASERALQVVERSFAAFNNANARALIGDNYDAPLRLIASPVTLPSNYADMLATMIPLVLVLMTMAGAVYPAIDLTAGERERGTMEALVVSPTPSFLLLLAKYSAVVTVSLLTALANLLAMTITLWASGMGKVIFGQTTLSLDMIGQVLALLVLFTTFFSALLLAITSFARSFKEAQAYLIPVMLLALTPGVLSLLPGIQFTNSGGNDSAGEYRVAREAIADRCCGMEHSHGGGHLHWHLRSYGAGGCESFVRFGRFDAGKSRKLARSAAPATDHC